MREIEEAIRRNLKLDIIGKIIILNESKNFPVFNSSKIIEIKINSRPTYDDFFQVINESSLNANINIISNSDIYFDKNIGVLEHLELKDKCFALSRWDVQPDGSARLRDRNDSQDAWVFKGKIKKVKGDFPIGVPRCDNRIMYELFQAGYEVLNPAYSIKCFHLHAGVRREYPSNEELEEFVEPPYRYLYPHNALSLLGTLVFNLFHKEKLAPYRYDKKRIDRWLLVRAYRKLRDLLMGKKVIL
ncbi:MAG: hypothetical protein GF392_03325 [Candidatus Omnitrophica bacterium]|nr:hypothetical protein [Candidatus Omnitrophota bacterium]